MRALHARMPLHANPNPFLIGAILVFAAPLAASQEPTPVAKPTPKTDSRPAQVTIPAVDADPAKKGTSSRPSESRPSVLFHARVQVVLKNGQKLQGVVKNNRFVEKESGLGFAVATKDEPMCGLRLWFTSPGQNWLFLSYRDLTSVDTIGRISDIEVRELEAKLDAEMNGKLAKETAERVGEVQAELKAREDARKAEQAASEKAKKRRR